MSRERAAMNTLQPQEDWYVVEHESGSELVAPIEDLRPASTYSYSGCELAAPIEDLRPSGAHGCHWRQERARKREQDQSELVATRQHADSSGGVPPATQVACRPTQLMSSAEQQIQVERFRAILGILNLNGTEWAARGWQNWVQTFGEMGNERSTMFGEYVWSGMAAWFQNRYIHRHRMATPEELTIGWFQLPADFSRAAAQAPATEYDFHFYPAIFSETWVQGDLVPMACLHIVVVSSRPWYVHVSRVHCTQTLRIFLC